MSRPWVLVDVSYLAYRALHVMGDLAHDFSPTGVVFGLFTQLKQICSHPHVQSNRVCLFFDSRHSFRRDAYSEYKRKRHDKREADPEGYRRVKTLWKQVNTLEKLFPKMGIPVYRQRGLESDDLIAQAAHQVKARGERAIMVTADGDLYQAIRASVHWFDPMRGHYYTPGDFEAVKGIAPARWGDVKVLAGCHGDNVPGIPGVGEATAIKYLLGTLPTHLKSYKKITSPLGRAVQRRNKELVKLPHARTKEVDLREVQINMREFRKICERFGLRSFMRRDKWASWKRFWQRGPLGLRLRKVKR